MECNIGCFAGECVTECGVSECGPEPEATALFPARAPRTGMDWAALFERGAKYETDAESIRESLAARRQGHDRADADAGEASDGE